MWALLLAIVAAAALSGCSSDFDSTGYRPVQSGVLLEGLDGEILLVDLDIGGRLGLYRLEGEAFGAVLLTGSPPPNRTGYMAAYDETRRRVVIFGGADIREGKCLNDTWVAQDGQWRELEGSAPPARDTGRLWFDRRFGRIQLQGGSDLLCEGRVMHDEWTLDGDRWLRIREDFKR